MQISGGVPAVEDLESIDAQARAAPARTPIEEVLAGIWEDSFGRAPIGLRERFADLGGHSLLAIQIVGRARAAFQIELPLRAIFDAPTIADLAARIEADLRAGWRIVMPPFHRMPRAGRLELSFGQERLWFLAQLAPDDPSYNIPWGMRLTGALDVASLERALAEVVRRHEVLRTTLATEEGRPAPVVREAPAANLAVDDLSALPAEERSRAVELRIAAEARAPFDLGLGPLLRAKLLRLSVDEHVLLLTMHHIVSDAASRRILDREITKLYEAFRLGRGSPLREPALQYADCAYWQRRWLRGEAYDAHVAYWKKALAGAPATIDLPADRPRPPVASRRGGRRSFRVSPEISGALREVARRSNATLFMTLLSAFAVLLQRWSGQRDLSVGTPTAGRTHPEMEELVGCFVNPVVLRILVPRAGSFRDLLASVREVCLDAYAHEAMPFERLVQELSPGRGLARSPLFQVMFLYENAPQEGPVLAGVRQRGVPVDGGTAKVDLTLAMTSTHARIFGSIEYASDLFDASTVERMAGQLAVLLEAIARDPEARLDDLPWLTSGEREWLLAAGTGAAAPFPEGATLHELFEAQAARTPDAVALRCEGQDTTYRELGERSRRLAAHLSDLGVTRDEIVGICVDRSASMVVGLLGILAAGGAFLPLDPASPPARRAFVLGDARVRVLVTTARLAPDLAGHAVRLVRVDGELPARAPSARVPVRATSRDLAYVVYTSGSTGDPKGVLATHVAAVNRFTWMWRAHPFDPGEVCCQKTALTFVDSIWEIFGPLLAGVPLVILPDEVRNDPPRMIAALARHRVTRIVLVPSLLVALLDTGGDLARRLPDLRRWTSSGEALPAALADRFRRELPGRVLLNLYGSSEVAADVTCFEVTRGGWEHRVPIGRPIDNVRVDVLDPHLAPVPIGVIGEICVGGVAVARGYLRRPELTAERFVPDPFVPGGRLYRTADLGRRLASGDIEIFGRADGQVKVRGHRIELGEIEAALRRHPAVRASVVIAREDARGDVRLVAYVVYAEGAAPAIKELDRALRASLPEIMIPASFVVLPSLPLNASGKVDLPALPSPKKGVVASSPYVEPRDAMEESLGAIFADVLGLEVTDIGVARGFFELGGHSLLAVRLFAQIQRVFGEALPIATIFKAPTVEALARVIRAESAAVPRSLVELTPPNGDTRPLFWCGLNFAEMTRLARELPGQPLYHLQSGHFGVENPATHIRDLASRYVRDLRLTQPEGPYHIGGSCLDGFVAFEIALQLRAQGQEVACLMLLDRTGPDPRFKRYQGLRSTYYRMRIHQRNILRLGRERGFAYARDLFDRFRKRLWAQLASRDPREQTVLAYGKEDLQHLAQSALVTYAPRERYPGSVALLYSKTFMRVLPLELFPACGWSEAVTGTITRHALPCDHDALVSEAHTGAVAATIRGCLERSRSRHVAPGVSRERAARGGGRRPAPRPLHDEKRPADIERIGPLGAEPFIQRYVETNKPVVVTGVMGSWNLEDRWTPEYLERALGDSPVQIYNDYFDLTSLSSLRDFLRDHVRAAPRAGRERPYARWYTKLRDADFPWADQAFELLSPNWGVLPFLPQSDYVLPSSPAPKRLDPRVDLFPAKGLFISGPGAKTSLHVDPWGSDAVLCQLHGVKRWRMYSPDQAALLSKDGECVDLAAPDQAKFPRFHEARPTFEFQLVAGEVVYVPHGWFHHVETETASISLTWNFVHASTARAFITWIDACDVASRDADIVRFFSGARGSDTSLLQIREEAATAEASYRTRKRAL